VLAGGDAAHLAGDLAGGFYTQPTILKGHKKMRVFREEIFGPVVSVTTFAAGSTTDEGAIAVWSPSSRAAGA
jgi:aldehyde dehydrogenase